MRFASFRLQLRPEEFIAFREMAIQEARSMSSMGAYIIRLYMKERKLL